MFGDTRENDRFKSEHRHSWETVCMLRFVWNNEFGELKSNTVGTQTHLLDINRKAIVLKHTREHVGNFVSHSLQGVESHFHMQKS